MPKKRFSFPYLVGEPAGEDRVPGELAHVARGELPDLRGDGVLLHERLLREVELQRVVRRQGHVQAAGQVLGQRGPNQKRKIEVITSTLGDPNYISCRIHKK